MKSLAIVRRFLGVLVFALVGVTAQAQINQWVFRAHLLKPNINMACATGPDGRLYVFGGKGGSTYAEAYTPSTDSWAAIAPLPVGDGPGFAVTGPDQRIYIFFGSNAFAYDPTADSYATITLPPHYTRGGALGLDGKIYAVAFDGNVQIGYTMSYDTTTDTWKTLSTVTPIFNGYPTACGGPDGRLYAFGGQDKNGDAQALAEVYDSHADVWTKLPDMPHKHDAACSAFGGDGRAYVIDGYDQVNNTPPDAFDFTSNTWSPVPELNLPRFLGFALAAPDGRIFVLSGVAPGDQMESYQPPVLEAHGMSFSVQEGTPYTNTLATIQDLDTTQSAGDFTTSIDWGDGTVTTGTVTAGIDPGDFDVSGNHAYQKFGTYAVQVTITDEDGESAKTVGTATVSDATTIGSGKSFTAYTNVNFSGVIANFQDTNPLGQASDFTAVIFWGDGGSSSGTIVSDGNGGFNVVGSHTYTNTGQYQVSSKVADDGYVLLKGQANVYTPPPAVVANAFNSVEGATFSGQVATFTDQDPTLTATSFAATIDWGDGSTSSGTIGASGSGFTVSGKHTYAEEGSYSVTVTVTAGSASGSSIGGATVSDAPLAATGYNLTCKGTIFSDTVAFFTDADPGGAATDYAAGIVWGDGKSSNGTIVKFGSGFKVVGTHSYLKKGRYVITVHIKDEGGSTANATTQVNVGPVK